MVPMDGRSSLVWRHLFRPPPASRAAAQTRYRCDRVSAIPMPSYRNVASLPRGRRKTLRTYLNCFIFLYYSCPRWRILPRLITPRDDSSYNVLTAMLWDLRAHAESKLRRLTRVQQNLTSLQTSTVDADRAALKRSIENDLRDIFTITDTLRSAADAAVQAASLLP